MNIGELFISLGFDVDDKRLKDFNATMKAGLGEMLKLSAAATAGVYALNAFMESSINNAVQLRNFRNETGFASEEMQKFQNVVAMTNPAVSVEQAAASYKRLAQNLLEIRRGQGPSGALAKLGIDWRANMGPDYVIKQLQQTLPVVINQRGRGVASQLLDEIGVGAGSLNALLLPSGEYDRIGDRFAVSQENLDRLAKVGDALREISLEWAKFKADLIADWAEPLISGLRKADSALHELLTNIKAIADAWRGWPEIVKIATMAMAGLIGFVFALNIPLGGTILALGAIAFAVNDIGRAVRGLPTHSGALLENARDYVVEQMKGAAQWAGGVNREHFARQTNNVTMYIHSEGNPEEVAEAVNRRMQQQTWNLAYSGLNLGQLF